MEWAAGCGTSPPEQPILPGSSYRDLESRHAMLVFVLCQNEDDGRSGSLPSPLFEMR